MSTDISTTVIDHIDEANADDAINQINEAFWDIPFENSMFQTENFVIAASITPERAYRSIGLRLQSRLKALQEAKFGALKEAIDIEELEAKIANPDTNDFDRRRAQIDIDQKLSNQPFTAKLINDAVVECNVLYDHFKKLPKFTRAEFEAGEEQHFTARLTRAVQNIQGAQESLVNMNTDMPSFLKYEEQVALLEQQKQAALASK